VTGWQPNATGGKDRVPAVLFHGTKREHLPLIRASGLVPRQPAPWVGQYAGPEAVYLADGLGQAIANCEGAELIGRATDPEVRQVILDSVLAVDVTGLPLVQLGFYTCLQPIPPERLTRVADDPVLRRRLKTETGW
jgi:hypothetical protein